MLIVQLLPRDEKFFDLLIEEAETVLEASKLLSHGLANRASEKDSAQTAKKIRQLELKGDNVLRINYRRLHKRL